MVGLGTIIEGKNAVLSVLESGRATKISYLHQETKSENFETILNLAKRIVADGEGATKFITINIKKSKRKRV